MPLITKLRQKGLLGVIEAILARVEAPIGRLRRRTADLRMTRRAGHKVTTLHDNAPPLMLPKPAALKGILGLDTEAQLTADFLRGAASEVLLQRILKDLYTEGLLDTEKSIIDIGCWCGDSALDWARHLTGPGMVYAIDPSSKNLAFGRALAAANQISNITWVQAVCADIAGTPLGFARPLEHTRFHDATQADSTQVTSATLDTVIGPENVGSIGLLHVDVEGFEDRVLRGAAGIIAASQPVIVFEQHLCDDMPSGVPDHLAALGYQVFVVNEIIAHCRTDCRNCIAFPSEFAIPESTWNVSQDARNYVPAIWGPALIPVPPVPLTHAGHAPKVPCA